MSNSQSHDHLGYTIKTRWAELEQLNSAFGQWFDASFCVVPPDPREASWQAFPGAVFSSAAAAAENARRIAMISIEQDIAAHRSRTVGVSAITTGELCLAGRGASRPQRAAT